MLSGKGAKEKMNKKVLGIYGTGGTGWEIYELIPELKNPYWEKVVFIDDSKESCELNGVECIPFSVFVEKYPFDNAEIIISLGEPKYRELLYNKVTSRNYTLPTIIHPEAYISKRAKFGQGVIVKTRAMLSNVKIDNNSLIADLSTLGHGVIIGKHCVISGHSTVNGGSILKDNVYVGVSANIREDISIGKFSIISMAAAVFKDVKDEQIVMGNPARVIAKNEKKLVFQ